MRIEASPVKVAHPETSVAVAGIDTDGNPLVWFVMEMAPRANGFDMKTSIVFPQGFPDDYCKAHADHWREEIPGMITKAAPFLVQRLFGYQAPIKKLKEKFFIVPAD